MIKEAKMENEYVEADANDVLVVKEIKTIADGKHTAHITNVIRDIRQGFDYVDIFLELDDIEGSIKAGFPCNISDVSSFGKLLKSAGIDFEAGDKISLSDIKKKLIGRTVEFTTFQDEQFSKVVNKTIKFIG